MRQFINGMGVGILVATLVLAVTYMVKGKEISDTEVIRRAKQLGMVESSQSVIKEAADDRSDSPEDSDVTSETTPAGEEVSDTDILADADTPTDDESLTNVENIDTWIDTEQQEQTNEVLADEGQETIEDLTDSSDTVEVVISRGMDGVTVSYLLEEKGVVEDAMDFNKYLSDNQLQTYIMYGTYQLKKNSSYDEIKQQIITK